MKALIPVLVFLTVSAPVRGAAQTPAAEPSLPRFDVAASLGWYAAREEPSRTTYDSWYSHSLDRGIAAGFYWTEHLKSELEVGWTGTGELYAEHPDSIPAQQTYGFANHTYSTVNLAAAQRYQFGHNARFHPNLAAGALVEWVTHRTELGALYGRNGTVVQPARNLPPSTEVRLSAFVSSGFKAYFSERVFLRTDLRIGFARELTHTLLATGIGIDF